MPPCCGYPCNSTTGDPVPAVRTCSATPASTSMLDSWNPSIVTRSVDHVTVRHGDPELLASALDADERDVVTAVQRPCLARHHEVLLVGGLLAPDADRGPVRLVAEAVRDPE